MAEIVSRFTFFPADERQSLCIGRFLMAAARRPRPPASWRSARIARR
jgi:hypothetical protein